VRLNVLTGRFGRRLAIAFAAVAALTALLAALLISVMWASQFRQYVHGNLQTSADNAATLLSRSYAQSGQFTVEALAQLPRYGMLSAFGLQVIDSRGNVIYDDSAMAGLLTQGLPEQPVQASEQTGFTVTAPVLVEGKTIATVKVWNYGTHGLLTAKDLRFRSSSFYAISLAAVIAVALSSAAGLIYARRLVKPIEQVTEAAGELRSGNQSARTQMSGHDEIGLLGKTFDEMADAIEADRELERRLTADVAHELRTPLQAIQATVEAMQDGVLPMDEERLSTVRDETVRLSRLADGILELTRLERRAVPMRMSRIDLAEVARTAVDAHRALFESCDLVLSLDVASGVWIEGSHDRLVQAVGNLLSNAARYTPRGGQVMVAVRAEGEEAVVEVADSGPGIDEEDLEHVFQRFWRADEARNRASGGLGIGLAVVKEIVERHQGTVCARRRAEGGSIFALRFPRAFSLRAPGVARSDGAGR
jgi:two-component system sensor histidine kinase BaeS